jgi:hypothetical protein
MGLERRPFYRVERVSQGKEEGHRISCEWARKGRTHGLMWVKGNPGAGSLSHLEGLILGEEKKIATDPRLPYIVCKSIYNNNIQYMSRKKPLTFCL